MANLKRTSPMDETRLRGDAYLQTLLAEGVRTGVLSEADAENAQMGCIELLAAQIELENRGYSSSVPEETAQKLLSSIVYTVGLGLKTFPTADDAAEALKTTRMNVLYAQGGARIAKLLRETRALYKQARETRLDTANPYYRATLDSGFKAFFRRYDPEFAADESCFLPEYPLFFPLQGTIGAEFTHTYAQRFCMENRFCGLFPPEELQELFGTLPPDDPSVNLFRCVLNAAVGNLLLKGAPSLRFSEQDVRDLCELLQKKTPAEVERTLSDALPLPPDAEEELRQYVARSLHATVQTLCGCAKELPRFRMLFPVPEGEAKASKSLFRAGDRMPNEQYRALLEQLAQTRTAEERVHLVRTRIASLGDLTDLLCDAVWSEEELRALFATFDDLTVAALEKHASGEAELDRMEAYLPCLRAWIASLPAERRRELNTLSSQIEVEPF